MVMNIEKQENKHSKKAGMKRRIKSQTNKIQHLMVIIVCMSYFCNLNQKRLSHWMKTDKMGGAISSNSD